MTPLTVPQTPEQVMQAATARIAELEAELQEMKDRWMRVGGRDRQRARPRPSRGERDPPVCRAEVRPGRGGGRGQPAAAASTACPPPAAGEPEIVAKLREGLDGIERNFVAILERNGIKREDPTGTPFDPNLHQAMAEQESAAQPPGSVMQAWTPAWTLNGRLLRPAMVVVAKAPPAEIAARGQAGHHRLMRSCRRRTKIRPCRPLPGRPHPHTSTVI